MKKLIQKDCGHIGEDKICHWPGKHYDKKCPGKCDIWKPEAAVRDSVSNQHYKTHVSSQYQVVCQKTGEFFREVVNFGALLNEVSDFIGEGRGRGNDGEGLRSWLAENCPEVEYKSAMSYKAMAAKCATMIGGGTQALAVLQNKETVLAPGSDHDFIDVDAKYLEKRDELFEKADSRRKLEQMWLRFCGGKGGRQGGANKGQSGTGRRALTVEEQAKSAADEFREMIGSLFAYVVEQKKVMLLTAEEQDEFIGSLKRVAKSAEEMVG